jgi:hypothetical protein
VHEVRYAGCPALVAGVFEALHSVQVGGARAFVFLSGTGEAVDALAAPPERCEVVGRREA